MIELRWKKLPKMLSNHPFAVQIGDVDTRFAEFAVLQYRTKDKEVIDLGHKYVRWTDWQDVEIEGNE